jgi:RNA polymerase sigma factor (sigma-70 family)
VTSSQTDAELVRQFLAGERQAVDGVTLWIQRVGGSFRQRLGAGWDDVIQDVLIELTSLCRRGAYRGEGTFHNYVKKVTVNACIKRLRQRQRRRWDLFGNLDEALGAAGLEPVASEIDRFTLDIVERIWAQASPACQRLWRWIVQGYSYQDIAELEGESSGTLRVRALRCRRSAEAERQRLEQHPTSTDRAQ